MAKTSDKSSLTPTKTSVPKRDCEVEYIALLERQRNYDAEYAALLDERLGRYGY